MGPLLNACYPAAIIVVLYYVFVKNHADPKLMNGARYATIAAGISGMIDVLSSYNYLFGINSQAFSNFYAALPLSNVMLTWIPVSVIFFVIGMLTYKKKA